MNNKNATKEICNDNLMQELNSTLNFSAWKCIWVKVILTPCFHGNARVSIQY